MHVLHLVQFEIDYQPRCNSADGMFRIMKEAHCRLKCLRFAMDMSPDSLRIVRSALPELPWLEELSIMNSHKIILRQYSAIFDLALVSLLTPRFLAPSLV